MQTLCGRQVRKDRELVQWLSQTLPSAFLELDAAHPFSELDKLARNDHSKEPA